MSWFRKAENNSDLKRAEDRWVFPCGCYISFVVYIPHQYATYEDYRKISNVFVSHDHGFSMHDENCKKTTVQYVSEPTEYLCPVTQPHKHTCGAKKK